MVVVLFIAAFTIYSLTCADNHAQINLDAWSANYASWRIATTGVPWIDGLHIAPLDHNPIRDVWIMHAANGHTVIGRAPGVVAVGIPAYWITQPSSMTTLPGGVTAAFLVACAIVLLYASVKDLAPRGHALVAVLAFGFATPAWSVGADGIWPHTVTIFGIAGMAWASSRGRWWLVGVFGGVALWARLHAALIVAILGLFTAWRRRDTGMAIRVGTMSTAFLLLMGVWTRWMYGTWNPAGSYDSQTIANHVGESWHSLSNQLGLWVSPDRGIFVWTPAVLLLLPALVRSWRDLPDWAQGLVWSGLAYTLLQGALNPFTGGDLFYGYRYGLEFVVCTVPALTLSAARMGAAARWLIGPVLAVQALAIAMGAASNNYFLPESEVWHRNAFVSALADIGSAGWVITGCVALLGFVASVLSARRAPHLPRGGQLGDAAAET
jgi:hypothetical protein